FKFTMTEGARTALSACCSSVELADKAVRAPNSPNKTPFASCKPSNLRDDTSLRSMMTRGDDHRLALIHAQRGNLHDQHVFVFVHDQAAQKIALGIHHAERRRLRQMLFPDGQRGADALLEKLFVRLHAF